MTKKDVSELHKRLQLLIRRSEKVDDAKLRDTFVNIGTLEASLSSRDNKIIFGRRGTGKTHAMKYSREKNVENGDIAIFIDLRLLGSDISIYANQKEEFSHRSGKLLTDFVHAFHEEMRQVIIASAALGRYGNCAEALDELADASTHIEVLGMVEEATGSESTFQKSRSSDIGVRLDEQGVSASAGAKRGEYYTDNSVESSKVVGHRRYRIHFQSLTKAINNLVVATGVNVWLYLDEWSAVPSDLQPYLADMIRRTFFPISKLTVQIAAIEQRSQFYLPNKSGDYIGLELGADVPLSINLDDFMVFENNPNASRSFYISLLYNHLKSVDDSGETYSSEAFELQKSIFATQKSFEEFIKAAEGVPRDAISIIALAAQRASGKKLTVVGIRNAARDWFQQDKSNFLRQNGEADFFLRWLIDKVIGERKSRAFLVNAYDRSKVIEELFDHRLIHVLKRSISAHDHPGRRYMAYKLDYGCYVELMSTQRAPKGLFYEEGVDGEINEAVVDVPPDDYRAIRRAILDLKEFDFDKLRDKLAGRSIPNGPISMALEWDLSFSKILSNLLRSTRNSANAQMELFQPEADKET